MDWNSFLFGKNDWHFLIDVGIRTAAMFFVILVALRLLGKRGIHQLSVFELGVIIGLGSAAGDPMIYEDVGIIPSVVTFVVVVLIYRFITYLVSKSEKIELFIEGKPAYILRNGILLDTFKNQPIGKDELFATLRQNHVFHLGQVETVIIESDGKLSIFFHSDDNVKPGLPILPDALETFFTSVPEPGLYACLACGNTTNHAPQQTYHCTLCENNKCVAAQGGTRIK